MNYIIIMFDQFVAFANIAKHKFMNAIIGITDPGYYLLKNKNAPLSEE